MVVCKIFSEAVYLNKILLAPLLHDSIIPITNIKLSSIVAALSHFIFI